MTYTNSLRKLNRGLVLIDIENLVATANPTAEQVAGMAALLRGLIPGFDQAQRIVACSHHAAATASFAFGPARHLWRSGPDGADLALLDVLDKEQVAERFGHVTICSGDGIFAASAAALAGSGVHVTAVALEDQVSTRLRLAAHAIVLIPPGVPAATARSAV